MADYDPFVRSSKRVITKRRDSEPKNPAERRGFLYKNEGATKSGIVVPWDGIRFQGRGGKGN